MPELIDILNENGIKTGHIATRAEVHREGLWHRCIVVAIINNRNEVLLQQRSHNKDTCPDQWDVSVAGHIAANEDSLTAALREVNEELSFKNHYPLKPSDFRYMFSFRSIDLYSSNNRHDAVERQYYDFFILHQPNLDLKKLEVQPEEVQAIKLCPISEIRALANAHPEEFVERDAIYAALEEYCLKTSAPCPQLGNT